MINQYIQDPQLKTLWDIKQPHIRKHHERLMTTWIQMAQSYRDNIYRGQQTSDLVFRMWIHMGSHWLHQDPKLAIDPGTNHYLDQIMSGYLRWGVKNYPITPRITAHTLSCLDTADKGKEMLWSEYIRDVYQIIQYQTNKNLKPFEKMTREELLKWIQQQPESTVRRAVTAVTA